jgi:predicted AAA+ superfamily ATPase
MPTLPRSQFTCASRQADGGGDAVDIISGSSIISSSGSSGSSGSSIVVVVVDSSRTLLPMSLWRYTSIKLDIVKELETYFQLFTNAPVSVILQSMIERERYLRQLRGYRDKPLIKVLSGVRRCGKSTILRMFCEELLTSGTVTEEQMTIINFEDMAYRHLLSADRLYEYLQSIIRKGKKGARHYLFLDEVQNVAEFERVIDSLFAQQSTDIYLTGSNARFLSSDLATMLTGRYIEIKVYPLSFAEYVSTFDEPMNLTAAYGDYTTFGAFPEAVNLYRDNPDLVMPYLQSIYNTVVFKDIVARCGVREPGKLEDVIKYLFDNIGNVTSSKRIADYLTAEMRKTSNHTVDSYITALRDSFVIYSAGRYDIKGKKALQRLEKHYLVDTALRRLLSDTVPSDFGRVLENTVFMELRRRFDKVWFGKNREKEIDFVVRSLTGGIEYYQVALSVRDPKVLRRELEAFGTADDYPKTLLTLDQEEGDYSGIRQRNALAWLLDPDADSR